MASKTAGPKDWSDLFEVCPHLEEKIIRSLDLESALKCRLVCHSWRDTISEDAKFRTRIKETSMLKAVRLGPLSTNLLAKFRDVNKIFKSGWTPLGYAAQSGKAKVVEILISHGAEVNKRDKVIHYTKESGEYHGLPPLHHAIMNDHKDIVVYLIKKGASVDQKCKYWSKNNVEMQRVLKRSLILTYP